MASSSTSRWPVLRELISPRQVAADIRADRIRFMERDVGLTIKLFVLASFAYFLYSPEWFEGSPSIGQIGLETIRGAFISYLVLNILTGVVLLAMDHLALVLVEWSVFVVSLADSLFVALLVVITGGLESTIYWVFLFIIVRNAVGTPVVRRQIALNAVVIVLFVFAGFLDQTWRTLGAEYQKIEDVFAPATQKTKSPNSNTNAAARGVDSPNGAAVTPPPPAKGRKSNPPKRGLSTFEGQPDFGAAAMTTFLTMSEDRAWERVLTRVLLLTLLAASCYGINVLTDLRLALLEEAREFTMRQEQLRSTGRLAAEIAHQLKNPLAIINNAAFNLQRSFHDAKPAPGAHPGIIRDEINAHSNVAICVACSGAHLDIIRDEINRSDRIITELMGYAQLSEGRVEKLDLVEELDNAIAQAVPTGAGFEITIERDYRQPLPPLLLQRAHLREVFVNLLLNAREALKGRGRIRIAALTGERDSVIVSIHDDGPGIPESRQAQVFEAYYTTKEKGTGLGLAIVKHNVELYGGNIRLESGLGKGTRFTLHFPAKALLRVTS